MNSGLYTPEEIVEKSLCSLKRVWNHVNYEIGKGRAELNDIGQVVVLQRLTRRSTTGQHRRDESGKTAKDHVLLLWVKSTLSGEVLDVEGLSQQFGVEASTIRGWMSCRRNYEGTTFTGTEGWPRITHTILSDVMSAIKEASAKP